MYREHQFLFSGMLTYACCGSIITGEIKKGKYIYYHCANKTHKCPNKSIYVKEAEITAQIDEVIKRININDKHQEAIITALKESHIEEQRYHKEQIKTLQTACEKLKSRISALYTDKLDGLISNELWREKNDEWMMEHARLKSIMEAHEKADMSYMNEGIRISRIIWV